MTVQHLTPHGNNPCTGVIFFFCMTWIQSGAKQVGERKKIVLVGWQVAPYNMALPFEHHPFHQDYRTRWQLLAHQLSTTQGPAPAVEQHSTLLDILPSEEDHGGLA
jgi:hypothetical protein